MASMTCASFIIDEFHDVANVAVEGLTDFCEYGGSNIFTFTQFCDNP